jgi:thiol-disulfide isomerase/thioredoxin
MDQHTDVEVDRFVTARLAALAPAGSWEPNAAARMLDLQRRHARARSRRRRSASAAVAAGLVLVALPGTRAVGARCVGACVDAAARARQFWRGAEPEAGRVPAVGAALGDLAPDIVGTDRQNVPVQLSRLRGRVVVVNFWATWCGPCRAEIPMLNHLRDELGPRGLEVIGVSLDEEGWTAVSQFLAEQPIEYDITLGNDGVSDAFGGVTALPATFVIDRNGRIVMKTRGVLAAEQAATIAELVGR